MLVLAISALIFTTNVNAQTLPTQEEVRERAEKIRDRDADKKIYDELKKRDTSLEKRARKELEREIKREHDLVIKNFEMARRASVTGCDTLVTVMERATERSNLHPQVIQRVTNPNPFSIDISDENGIVVHGLCPHGSVTLSRVRGIWTDGDRFTFQWTAEGIFSDGSMGIVNSSQYTLSAYDVQNGQRTQRPPTWVVQLYKTYVQN